MLGFLTIMTLLPIIIVAVLLLVFKVPTLWCAVIGWAVAIVISLVVFNTSIEVGMRASIHGLLTSFPISIMVIFSILQVSFMESTGCIKRVAVFLKTLAPNNQEAQIMMLNLGAGTTLVSVGATPVSVLPPIMKSLGYSNMLCIALPAIGFDALCTYSMLAAPLMTYVDLTGVPLVEAAKVFSMFLPVVSTMICFGMFVLVGGAKMVKKGFLAALITGLVAGFTAFAIAHIPALESAIVLTGVIAGLASIVSMVIYLKAKKSVVIDRSVLSEEDKEIEKGMSLAKALSPWLILIVILLCVAFIPPIKNLLFVKLETAVSVVGGAQVKLRPLYNAYFWVLISTFLSFIVLRPTRAQLSETMKKWGRRAPKPGIATMVFFALGLLMNYTGYEIMADGTFSLIEQTNNMIFVLATVSADAFGALYPIIVAPLGMFGGFVTSSEASALAMFAQYNIQTGDMLGLNTLVLTAATGIAGGLASVISPAKLQNAAATIDAIGEEALVLKKTFKIAVMLLIAVIILTIIFCQAMPVEVGSSIAIDPNANPYH
ncbi:MAG: L-lactate permease [Bacillota bacterium]|jgi:lactate permease